MFKSIVALVLTCLLCLGFYDRHQLGTGDVSKDRWWRSSFQKILFIKSAVLCLECARYIFSQESFAREPWTLSEIVAASMAFIGVVLRLWSIYTLRRFFTFEVAIRPGHKLIADGPYAILRHPSYTGSIMGAYGLVYYLGGWHSIFRSPWFYAFSFPYAALVITARIKNEEEALESHFGEAWRRYAATRKRLIPGLF